MAVVIFYMPPVYPSVKRAVKTTSSVSSDPVDADDTKIIKLIYPMNYITNFLCAPLNLCVSVRDVTPSPPPPPNRPIPAHLVNRLAA